MGLIEIIGPIPIIIGSSDITIEHGGEGEIKSSLTIFPNKKIYILIRLFTYLMRRISLDLDDKLFESFAILCVKKRKRKVDVLREFVERWVKEEV